MDSAQPIGLVETELFVDRLEKCHSTLRAHALQYVRKGLADAQDADDLLQFTLLKAWENRDRYVHSSDAAWEGWLRRILRNRALNLIRRENRFRQIAMRVGTGNPPANDRMRQVEARLEEILGTLLEPERTIIALHFIEAKSWNELSAEHHQTPEAIRKRCERAIRKLKLGKAVNES